MLHKSFKPATNIDTAENHSAPEKGQHKLLCSNNSGSCCPFSAIEKPIPKEFMNTYIELGKILKGIHIRLITEGWKIEPGKFTRPDGTVIYAKNKHYKYKRD